MERTYDFAGWATRNDLKCSDGRIIRKDAFKHNDGGRVPLVWNHQHNEAYNVLGHADLENRPEGVYAYCTFNETEYGQNARELVKHGDITALSIYANQLRQIGSDVIHGAIREVSLVLAGANPGARIDTILEHSEGEDEEAIIETVLSEGLSLYHAENAAKEVKENETETKEPVIEHKEEPEMAEKTVKDVFDTLNEEQKNVVYAIIGQALEDAGVAENEEDEEVKHNVFDGDFENQENVLSHSDMMAVINDAKRYGSMKESCLQHGIENLEYLFPDAKTMDNKFHFVSRDMAWVNTLLNGVHHTPFSKLKCIFADITGDDARALGYQKGNLKKEEMFTLLKRTTEPTTIYKKQKFDRDDVIDITDFDVIAEVKSEMRTMLNEEIARAILTGDGRNASSDDKVDELKIRPVWTDNDFYTIHSTVAPAGANPTDTDKALEMIDQCVRALDDYKGSGNLVFFCDRKWLTSALLAKDADGHRLYKGVDEVATAMMVDKIVPVPVMKNLTRQDNSYTYTLMGIALDLNDYNVGADKGGAINMFDDFDIDYNQQKYLIETRISGSLVKPYAAIALELKASR